MYKCKNFKIVELVDPEVHKQFGDMAWLFLDEKALKTLDLLRDTFGPATVNNWHTGGKFKDSGLRSLNSTTGAQFSQHRFGRAFDMKFKDVLASDARTMIKSDELFWKTRISRIENDVNWLHFDLANCEGIKWINP